MPTFTAFFHMSSNASLIPLSKVTRCVLLQQVLSGVVHVNLKIYLHGRVHNVKVEHLLDRPDHSIESRLRVSYVKYFGNWVVVKFENSTTTGNCRTA
jgi:hypothetical protein